MFCKKCGAMVNDTAKFCTTCGNPIAVDEAAPAAEPAPAPATPAYQAPAAPAPSQGMNFDFNSNTAAVDQRVRYEYKILSQKDKWFSGKFDPMVLEQAINAYAQQGWRVISCATADIPGFGTTRQEFITVLEREVR